MKVTKIVGTEVELSLWATDTFSNGVAQACAQHNISITAYQYVHESSHAFWLTRKQVLTYRAGHAVRQSIRPERIPEGDFHRMPGYSGESFAKNLELVQELEKDRKRREATRPHN